MTVRDPTQSNEQSVAPQFEGVTGPELVACPVCLQLDVRSPDGAPACHDQEMERIDRETIEEFASEHGASERKLSVAVAVLEYAFAGRIISAAALASRCVFDRKTVSTQLRALADDGLLERHELPREADGTVAVYGLPVMTAPRRDRD